ncbi:nuclear transport factor 2 family protein [Novosphingobium taihuense]|uniref:SnoaL-like domain-containing protein n=1 Tax=Novosphingobium taihuense TaxID=260085 RepID=A0A7W7AEV8_9SPHN|nr:nuclear transport factor 2 family protein [Novosphingobium taihuense]MBB4615029.1 hypothetical protein [Novosphingobium taihuense]TWH84529.1 SnoaL-like protein [Novosphingobium taihuense]
MDVGQRLLAIEDIKKVKARYCRFVDTKQWDELRNLFSEDAIFDGQSAGMGDIADREQFVAMAQAGLINAVSVHHVHGHEIEFTSDTSADAICAMEDMLQWAQGSGSPISTLHGMGHYHETYTKVGDCWKITSWQLTRLRVDTVAA